MVAETEPVAPWISCAVFVHQASVARASVASFSAVERHSGGALFCSARCLARALGWSEGSPFRRTLVSSRASSAGIRRPVPGRKKCPVERRKMRRSPWAILAHADRNGPRIRARIRLTTEKWPAFILLSHHSALEFFCWTQLRERPRGRATVRGFADAALFRSSRRMRSICRGGWSPDAAAAARVRVLRRSRGARVQRPRPRSRWCRRAFASGRGTHRLRNSQ